MTQTKPTAERFQVSGRMIYSLMPSGFRKNVQQFVNRIWIQLEADKTVSVEEISESCDLIADAFNVLHETGMGPRELAEQNRQLRVLLAGACAGVNLYSDDGELQDNSTRPHIDFLRMSPTELGAAFYERAKAKIALARNETE